ncbi:MAG: hypothetical protein IPL71_03550 [Anaerolineales bacterium]|uniref:hypothetical protein n=1 Tax=Candidatus Villigracilis proximus TaxID=3140683 RepID=UPI003136A07A|nr:hypothetical protein [Anaerolineales bacterium]
MRLSQKAMWASVDAIVQPATVDRAKLIVTHAFNERAHFLARDFVGDLKVAVH